MHNEGRTVDLRQLQYFVVAARAEHFTRAAAQLNVVQSALSSAIKALEEELDAPLFIRSTRKVRLTAAGRALLERPKRCWKRLRMRAGLFMMSPMPKVAGSRSEP
ncbi:LysR family transcriptional regulator [Devosia riboflavina]|uniref:LysR family transcriptional regulator n=1 Tax=Devosia riboflavina TaxID=46914 RepID=UPI001FCC66DE|nr:LysR family transcriptional regulator [Devosia riboflavina]